MVSNYSHIHFASTELAYVLLKNRSMRWRDQVDTVESIVLFHELDIETVDFDWVISKAEQYVHQIKPDVKRAGW
jgi:hypothetical protein